jgi:hypothetical protein
MYVHKKVLSTYLDGITIDANRWILEHLSGSHFVLPPMPWAGDHIAFKGPLPQGTSTVQAKIIERVEFTTNICNRYGFSFDLQLTDGSRGEFL